MTIYELTDEYRQLLLWAEEEELDEQTLQDTLEGLDGEIEAKADGYAKVITQLGLDAAGLKNEIERLFVRKKKIENNIDSMKRTLQFAMEATGKKKFKTQLFSFGIQKNPASLKIDDLTKVPKKYLIAQEPKIDNAAIKKDLKEGTKYDWCHLESTESLRIR